MSRFGFHVSAAVQTSSLEAGLIYQQLGDMAKEAQVRRYEMMVRLGCIAPVDITGH